MNEMSILALAKICGEAGKDHATVNMIRKCLDNDVPNEYLKLLLSNSDTEELKAYRDTGLTPEKIREFDREYQRKCKLIKSLAEINDKLRKKLEKCSTERVKNNTPENILDKMNINDISKVRGIVRSAIKNGACIYSIGACVTEHSAFLKQILTENGICGTLPIVSMQSDYEKAMNMEWNYFSADACGTKELIDKILSCPGPKPKDVFTINCSVKDDVLVVESINEALKTHDGKYTIMSLYFNAPVKPMDEIPSCSETIDTKSIIIENRPVAERTTEEVTEDAHTVTEEDAEKTVEADNAVVEEKVEAFTGTIGTAKEADILKHSNAHITKEADGAVAENTEEATVEGNSADVEAAEETAEDDKNKGGKKRKLDIGKIMALKNAGWKIKDIAYELHTSPAVISNAIWKHTKKEIKETK